MWNSALLTTLGDLDGIILCVTLPPAWRCLNLVSKWWKLSWEAKNRPDGCASRSSRAWRKLPWKQGNEAFLFWWCSGTDYVMQKLRSRVEVHRKMRSCKKSARINMDTRLRKKHIGSFYVLNYWLCGLCNQGTWIAKRLYGDIRA